MSLDQSLSAYAFLGEKDWYDRLCAYARKRLGPMADRADLQPESIVGSVVRNEIAKDKLLGKANNEQHLQAMLFRAIHFKIIDRLRMTGRAQNLDDWNQVQSSRELDESIEHVFAEEGSGFYDPAQSLQAIQQRIHAVSTTPRDRALIQRLFMAEPPSWQETARQMECSVQAAKTAMSRLKPKLLEAIIDPMRWKLSGADWGILKQFIVFRRDGQTAAEKLGLDPAQMQQRFETAIYPKLIRTIGTEGVALLWQLFGGKERAPGGQKD